MPVLTDLTVRQPESPSPLQTVGALMQLRGQQGEMALRNAQLQQANAQTEDIHAQATQRNRDIADQNTIQEAMKDPTVAQAIGSGDLTALNGKVQPKNLSGLQTQVLAQQQAIANKNKTDLELHTQQLGQLADGIAGLKLLGEQNPDGLAAAYSQWKNTVEGAKIVGTGRLPDQISGPEDLDKIAGVTGAYLGMHQKVQADQGAAQKIRTDAASEAMDTAHAAQFTADAAKLAQDTINARSNLKKIDADAQIAQLEADFAAKHGGMKPAEAETARHNKADEATAAGELGLKTKTFNMTYGPNSINQGLIGVQPHLIVPATSAYTKAGEEYATAVHASDAMNTLLDLAQKGNKAAGSNLPLVGVETVNALNGIKRINSAEISQYGSAGSLLDQVKGKIGKLAVGKPIPQDVLDDIRELHTQLATSSKDLYARKVQVVNGAYGSKFAPVEFSGSAPAPASTVNLRAPDGTIKPIPSDQVDHFLQLGATRVP